MESLIPVSLWSGYPVAGACGMKLIQVSYGRVYAPADGFFFALVIAFEHYAHGIQVIDFFEWQMFCFHLVVDGIDRFQTGFGIVFYAKAVELAFDRFREIRIDG